MNDAMRKKGELDAWNAGWSANRDRKLTMGLSATPSGRLAWLEEMIALAHASGALPKPRPPNEG
ncbi:MAG: hypothetical protein NVS3B20_18970 [Polyangiales bacterium]